MSQQKGNQLLKDILKSKWYPGILQWPTLVVFTVIMYELLIGIPVANDNSYSICWPKESLYYSQVWRCLVLRTKEHLQL